MSPRLLVGLGNPTEKYTRTRHNVGRRYIEYLLDESDSSFTSSRQAEFFRLPVFFGIHLDEPLICARLTCFMNESGPALKTLMDKNNIGPDGLLVLVDDFMIPFGSLRIRSKGSSGGHNGLKSIIETLGTEAFGRLRFGIGPTPDGDDPAEFVLKRFSKIEEEKLPSLFDATTEALKILLQHGYEKAMNAYNKELL